MKKVRLFAILMISFLMLAISGTFAQPAPHFRWLHDKLNLTDDQEKKLDDIRTAHWDKMMSYRDEIQKLAIDMRALGRKDNITVSEYNKMKDQMQEVREKMKEERDSHEAAVLNVLDDAQKTEWLKFKLNRPGRGNGFGKGLGPCGGDGPGKGGYGFHGGGRGMKFRGGDFDGPRGPFCPR
ncbi:MAG: periplasmic heavy metal sensor [Ignavibacteriaceae bacterium]|nr:Spy/CpxP family protein refolding chaperone [Ignavibacteriaceae bacterium]NUM69558.1 periplasmic heavy metal sensor [Ignavibacteriaceae bacterium]